MDSLDVLHTKQCEAVSRQHRSSHFQNGVQMRRICYVFTVYKPHGLTVCDHTKLIACFQFAWARDQMLHQRLGSFLDLVEQVLGPVDSATVDEVL